MTNFNHTAIAKDVALQIEQIVTAGGWTNNDVIAVRVMMAMEFIDAQLNYLNKEDAKFWETIIGLYQDARTPIKGFGQMIYNVEGGRDSLKKARKLVLAAVELMAQKLEGGSAADLDFVWREVTQLQLLGLYKQIKQNAGNEAAELVVEANNKLSTAVNMELELANRVA